MDNSKWLLYWRLSATSVLTNQNFFVLGLPIVNTYNYRTYSQIVPQSQGGSRRQGYTNIPILWDDMTFSQFATLTQIVEEALSSNVIYATIDANNGYGLNRFIDIHGVPNPITYTPTTNGRGVMYMNIQLNINNITVDSDPSTVIL